ncbi:MAG: M24 family metallopeptidase [Actinobacteria bacterium]|nr:M24 family metallopeptidase [Actinomycetota bacterium]
MEESNFNKEFTLKKIKLIEYLESKSLDGILMTKRSNYSWITCGYRNKIMDSAQLGASSILFYKGIFYLITTNIEIERMISEELNNFFPIEKVIYDWFSPDGLKESLKKVTGLKKIVQDYLVVEGLNIVENDFNYLKFELTEQEIIRYIELGQIVSKCMTEVCFNINQGMTELEVQGVLSNHLISNGVMPLIILVGSDDRIFKYRHPIPTTKKIEKYIMIVVGAEKWGLIVAITRLVHFGALSANLEKIKEDAIYIDADMILNSKPGIKYSEILERAAANYNKLGYRDEWKKHHQGGPIGYEGRYFLTTFNNTLNIEENHAIAWNPSITGFKSEDTFIVGKTGNNLISLDDKWPLVKVECKEKNILRADILIK